MNLLDYLRTNEKILNSGSDHLHKKLISDINSNLKKINIDNVLYTFKEVALRENSKIIGAADLVVIAKDAIYVVEGKVVRGNSNRKSKSSLKNIKYELNQQMKKAYSFFKNNFNIPVKCIGVYRSSGANKIHHYVLESPLEDLLKKTLLPEFNH